jgi:hypothetical protein
MKARCLTLVIAILSLGHTTSLLAQTAADCLNLRLSQQGTVVEQRFRSKDRESGDRFVWDSTYTVIGKENFKGKSALLVTSEATLTQGGVTSVVQSENYFNVQKAKSRIRTYGSVGTTFLDGVQQGSAEVTYDPPQLTRYDLSPKQRHTQKLDVEVVTDAPQGTFVDSYKERVTRIYLGRQTIKVPLGRRQACKFRTVSAVSQLGVTTKYVSTEWHDVKSGLVLKAVSDSDITVLVRAKIDGANI